MLRKVDPSPRAAGLKGTGMSLFLGDTTAVAVGRVGVAGGQAGGASMGVMAKRRSVRTPDKCHGARAVATHMRAGSRESLGGTLTPVGRRWAPSWGARRALGEAFEAGVPCAGASFTLLLNSAALADHPARLFDGFRGFGGLDGSRMRTWRVTGQQ